MTSSLGTQHVGLGRARGLFETGEERHPRSVIAQISQVARQTFTGRPRGTLALTAPDLTPRPATPLGTRCQVAGVLG